jgi:hypothetical protein
MNPVTRELHDVIERLAEQGVLSATDTRVIYRVLEQVPDSPPSAPQTLSGPYWEARHRALHEAGPAPAGAAATATACAEAPALATAIAALR